MVDKHVRRTGDDYGEVLLTLLPQGEAWPRNEDLDLAIAVNGLAQIVGYADGRAADFLEIEADPRTTNEMLDSWEIAFGLPDQCIALPSTDPVIRRVNLVDRMILLGAQDRQFFIDRATIVGQAITVREWAPYMCGISRCGDTRMASLTDDIANFRWELGPPEI